MNSRKNCTHFKGDINTKKLFLFILLNLFYEILNKGRLNFIFINLPCSQKENFLIIFFAGKNEKSKILMSKNKE